MRRIRHGTGCGHGGDGRLRVRRWRREARRLNLYRRAVAGATSADPARHGCGRGNDGRMRAAGAAAPPPLLIGGGHDVGGSVTARLRDVRRRRIRPELRAPRARIWRASCTGDGGNGCDGQLRAGGKAAADPATALPLRARRNLRGGGLHDGHLHNAPPSMSGASGNKILTYAIDCEDRHPQTLRATKQNDARHKR
uniref:Uncharacterized protein n=1 Tax=Oryza rufipogon TaxID=4529 RepID=A0A0E0QHU8_ORYRU